MEDYELAYSLLVPEKVPVWRCNALLWLDEEGRPNLTARVTMVEKDPSAPGSEKAGEIRAAKFRFEGDKWVKYAEEKAQTG